MSTDRVSTLQANQEGILQAIRTLYLPDGPEADVTFSTGGIYASGTMPMPRLKFDLAPALPDVVEADCRRLPVDAESIGSILYDPPFIVAAGKESRIGQRFSSLRTIPLLHELYRDSIREFARVLQPGGILVVKIQDTVSGGKQHRGSIVIWQEALACDLVDEDWLLCPNVSRMVGHNWARQQHARKTHVHWLIFRKPRAARRGRAA